MKKKITLAILTLTVVFSGVFLPANLAMGQDASISSAISAQDVTNPSYETRLEKCTLTDFNIGGCFARLAYFLSWVSAEIVSLVAQILDYFIAYSIDSSSYQGSYNTFVEKGWSVVRDIANVAFIFTLLYIAIKHILQAASAGTKKLLANLIIAALLINFSLFFTKIIIDGGNILARAFYNNIEIVNNPDNDHKAITQGLADYIQPQRLLSSDLFKPDQSAGRYSQTVDSGWAFLILSISIFVNITIALVFLSTFLLFAARVIGLWFMMIFSPLAFMSIAIPKSSSFLGEFGWSTWLKQTVALSFMAPIFLFFIFLTIMFLQIFYSGPSLGAEQTVMQKLMAIVIPFATIVVIVKLAKDKAKDMSGKFGEMVLKTVGKVAGVAIGAGGLALGGAALASRATLGAVGRRITTSETLSKGLKSKHRFVRGISRFTRESGSLASRSSFDARNTWVGKRGLGLAQQAAGEATGQKSINTKIFGFDTQKGGGVGGYRQAQKDTKKKALERSEKRNVSYEESSEYRKLLLAKNERVRELEKEGKTEEQIKNDLGLGRIDANIKTEKKKIDDLNRGSQTTQAWWQQRYVWQAGRKEAADAVRAGKKPEGEMDKLLKELRKKEKEEAKSGGEGSGGDTGFQRGAPAASPETPNTGTAPGGVAGEGAEKLIRAVGDVGQRISQEGNLERKRDISETKIIGGLDKDIGSLKGNVPQGASIKSAGGGIKEERNLAGFGERGTSTPNENSGPAGFKPPEKDNSDKESET